jgi:small-conductance mechanosensitive channel
MVNRMVQWIDNFLMEDLMEVINWMLNWQEMPFAQEINFIAFVILVIVLRFIFLRVGKKFVEKRELNSSDLFPFIKSMVNWGVFYSILIFIIVYFPQEEWLTYELFSFGGNMITVVNIIIAVMIVTLGFRVSQFFSRFILKTAFKKYNLDSGVQYTFTRISHYTIVILAVMISVMNMGIDLSALTVFASIIGVGIGFGLQNITSNFISGIILLFERPIKVDDVVKVNETLGIVEEIKMRATIIRTFDNERIIIPNSQFIENQVVNLTYADERMRLTVNVGVAYGSDTLLVKELLLQAAHEQEHVMPDPEPRVDFLAFGDSSLDFRLIAWVPSLDFRLLTVSNINFRVNELFNQQGIEIPFPQRDLHLRSVDQDILNQFKHTKTFSDKRDVD